MNLITALTTLQATSKGDVSVTQTATLVRNAQQPLMTMARVSCMMPMDKGFGWTTFEAPNLEAAVAKALEAMNAKG